MPAIESRIGNAFRRGHGPLLLFEAGEVLVSIQRPGPKGAELVMPYHLSVFG